MKTSTLLLAAGLTTALAVPAFADQPGADWIPLDQAVRKLSEAGYADVRKLKADDGHWEGKATKDGKTVEVHVDPHSGAVTQEQDDD